MILTHHGIDSLRRVEYYDGPTLDGVTYKAVKIGNKLWTCKNLNYLDSSFNLNPNNNISSKGCWYYDINQNLYEFLGLFYNYYAVKYINDYILTDGWRVPNNLDWDELIQNNSYNDLVSKKYWNNPAYSGKNKKGLDLIPNGRIQDAYSAYYGDFGYYWSLTEHNSNIAYITNVVNLAIVLTQKYKFYGFGIRLCKDVV